MLKTGFNPQYNIEDGLQKTIRHEFEKKIIFQLFFYKTFTR